ncbi:recombinase family protein [Paenibacillus sp. F411]|nr:recombinase family protein [Paenibacillus sp. F411]
MNVVGYLRVSTQGQAREGDGLKSQEDEFKAYCEEQGFIEYVVVGQTKL